MISIITAIRNQRAVNKLFFESLKKYSALPFELIIVDNGSDDGSAEYFAEGGAKIIKNEANYSYPYSQNQGIAAAKYDVLAFLNNDIIVAPGWDAKIVRAMESNSADVISPCGIERLETHEETNRMQRRWKAVKNPINFLFGINRTTLIAMFTLMYGNWQKFNKRRFEKFGHTVQEGFNGNSIIMHKSALDKIGLWDERIQGADFDIFLRTKKRSLEIGDIKPMQVALGVFNHHFIRITAKAAPPPFADRENLIALEDKWGREAVQFYLKDIWV